MSEQECLGLVERDFVIETEPPPAVEQVSLPTAAALAAAVTVDHTELVAHEARVLNASAVTSTNDDQDGDEGRLPPPHPRFAAHFTASRYDADDYRNDDLPPFGNDEGSDEVHDWADRLDELRAQPTLRFMIGDNADEFVAELRDTEQLDVDDIVVGRGFTLLRFTGQIDDEGRGWLTEALVRQDARYEHTEYATMLDDLRAYV